MDDRSSVFFGAIALAVALASVPARPVQAITPDASAVSVSTPVCSYGRVNVASLDGRPGMKFFLDGAEAFRRKDYRHAVYMYKLAASWADKPAEYDLGLMYFRGEGVPVDRPLGAAWMVLAAERGDKSLYARARDLMVSLLTNSEFKRMNELWNKLGSTYGDGGLALRKAKAYLAWAGAHDNVGSHLADGIAGNVHEARFGPDGSLQEMPVASVDDALHPGQAAQANNFDDPKILNCPTGTVKVEPLQQVKTDSGGAPESSSQPGSSGKPLQNP